MKIFQIKGKETRNVYDIDTDYKFFPLIEYNTSIYLENSEDNEYHYGNEMNVLPSLSDITQFDISPLLRDTPSDDQIEVYIACLTENTICYMPGESSNAKTFTNKLIDRFFFLFFLFRLGCCDDFLLFEKIKPKQKMFVFEQ